MQKNHGIKGNLNQWGRNVTKKEDKKCIILKMAKLSHDKQRLIALYKPNKHQNF